MGGKNNVVLHSQLPALDLAAAPEWLKSAYAERLTYAYRSMAGRHILSGLEARLHLIHLLKLTARKPPMPIGATRYVQFKKTKKQAI